ncbi:MULTISPECIES: ABC transporter substrate-binding protein [Pseudarthrobacter]|jgi:putative spermidine/putrescine transport system substrate-binding protein|uniref:Polyamine ABC transporter substrate-binding protein n=1 Tax=Pseudarthrobacter polychromogenes TaxID=1676 RepID=A0ABQ1XZ48_9MICC|nr:MULTISPECIES: ABC transporter substrate-binding protein [Pseudarthrobacter]MBD1593971.1 ABC transporter substrate-binding protein [Arthrobacter sp. S1_S22]TPV53482.1 ABC transporter substrate-binding protein [Pseudarthrobacter phenanthrenivorans]GGH06801.1 polyamine ABC transporter substrate-binding protein [Pseudarthrobacter polychromogenes]
MRATIKGKMAAVAALSAAVLVLSGCGGGSEAAGSGGSATSGEVNLIAYSGVWQDQYTAAVIEPFQAKYPDIKINYASKRSSAEMLSALQGQKNNPATDVAIMDNSVSTTGNKQGLFEKVDEESVPNLANVPEKFQDKEGYGPVAMLDAVGLVYDTATFPEAPDSWKVLWDPAYAGKINVNAPPSLLGLSLTAITSKMEGEDYTQGIDSAVTRLKEMAPGVQTFAPNPDEYQNVITGQTVLGLGQNARGQFYSDQSNKKMGVTFPKEGTVYQINTINLVKDAPHSEAAKTFVDYALSAEAQTAFAKALFYAPSVTNAELPADVKDRVVPTDGSLNIVPLDVEFLSSARDKWTDTWKRQIITN